MKFTTREYNGPGRHFSLRVEQGDHLVNQNPELKEPIVIKGDGRFEEDFKPTLTEPYVDLVDPRIGKMMAASKEASTKEKPEKYLQDMAHEVLGPKWELDSYNMGKDNRQPNIYFETNEFGWGGQLSLRFRRSGEEINYDKAYIVSSAANEDTNDTQTLYGDWNPETQTVDPHHEEVKFRVQEHRT